MKTSTHIDRLIGEVKGPADKSAGASAKSASVSNEILIVEDDKLTRMLIERLLKKEFNANTVSRANGIEGLEYARENIPQLIILDLMLPGMNGFDILKEIRESALFEDTKVVLVSAKSRSEDIERGFDLTADEYITKPFQPKEFAARIRNLLKRAA